MSNPKPVKLRESEIAAALSELPGWQMNSGSAGH
jgi:hypothetical protein